ncbi:MAG: hypothetical protein HOE00_00105 [Euryarchaeota archaeon]|jgi:nickel-type superoxide dismutase maturation protease|nr:hypothetical protein [Euryarchaeota archaeon]MBT3847514.1 hypothetical protein [Euryarchaeota archaeon]MBT4156173.1 hypothetical protein [Euryarchaeota archaeon]MBT4179996.1 hypothetical protein [Euryarchaeota archaeon]MBT4475954.1 hypothetical protein [Euryarchaeota archaeon]
MDSRFLDIRVKGDSMWPTLEDGSVVRFERIRGTALQINQIVLCNHPLRAKFLVIKRISSIDDKTAFLVGDNPDPTASEDSHNFGRVEIKNILACMIEN